MSGADTTGSPVWDARSRPPKRAASSGCSSTHAQAVCFRAEVDVRTETWSATVFRALLALYPAAFRDEYGRELILVFVDRYRDAGSAWERVRIWLEVLSGIAAEAPKEHGHMILQDLRYAWRTLRKQMLVTATIVVTLGLGI